jgi:hypothetical protein
MKGKQCYARFGPSNIHWMKLDKGERGYDWNQFIDQVKALPTGWKFRHNEAGDLPGNNNAIDNSMLKQLVRAVKHKSLKAWTYTHKPLTKKNIAAIAAANKNGFTVNISADSMAEADEARSLDLPAVVIVPLGTPNGKLTPDGNKIVICPAQTKGMTCAECMLCQKSERTCIVGFYPHGTAAKSLNVAVTNRI